MSVKYLGKAKPKVYSNWTPLGQALFDLQEVQTKLHVWYTAKKTPGPNELLQAARTVDRALEEIRSQLMVAREHLELEKS